MWVMIDFKKWRIKESNRSVRWFGRCFCTSQTFTSSLLTVNKEDPERIYFLCHEDAWGVLASPFQAVCGVYARPPLQSGQINTVYTNPLPRRRKRRPAMCSAHQSTQMYICIIRLLFNWETLPCCFLIFPFTSSCLSCSDPPERSVWEVGGGKEAALSFHWLALFCLARLALVCAEPWIQTPLLFPPGRSAYCPLERCIVVC